MIRLSPTDEQKLYAYHQAYWYDWGKRKSFNGNRGQKLIGILAQTMVADMLMKPRPDGTDGFDGGIDLTVNGKTVDVKCMQRMCGITKEYVHNICGYQKDYQVDYYIFTSFNTKCNELEICGIIGKENFYNIADRYEVGEERKRADGSKFKLKAPLYEISQKQLIEVNSLEELEGVFINGTKENV